MTDAFESARPYPPERIANIAFLVSTGQGQAAIAKHLGLSMRAYRECLKADEALQDAIAEGEERLHERLVQVVLAEAESGKNRLSAAKFLLEAKFGYAERRDVTTQAVAITFTMPQPEPLERFRERTRLQRILAEPSKDNEPA